MKISANVVGAALAAAVSIGMATGTAGASERKLVIGTEGAYPPFNSLNPDGSLSGFDIDIAKALCKEINAECTFVAQDWDGIIPALLAGKFDAIVASMSITDERKKQVLFTEKYYNTPSAIVIPKDSSIVGVEAPDLANKVIAAQSSTTHANYAQAYFKETELRLYPTADEYRLDIASGRVDAAIDDSVVLSEWLKSVDGNCCKLLGTVKVDPLINGDGAGIALRKDDVELRDRLNSAIHTIRLNGEYQRISSKYFTFDVYGD